MSTLSDHGHDHDHVGFGGAAVTFLILGALEILLGILVSNPAVTNLGLHDLSDVVLPAIAAGAAFLVTWLEYHFPKCQAEIWVAFGTGISNILVIGLFTILSIPAGINLEQMLLGVGSAIVSYTANLFWSRRLHCHDDEARKAVSDHLLLDAKAAASVGIGSILAFAIGMIWPAVLAAVYVLWITVRHSVPELVRLSRKFHRKANHIDH